MISTSTHPHPPFISKGDGFRPRGVVNTPAKILFLKMRGPNLAPYYLDSRGPIQALHRPIKPFLRLRFWRIEGSNAAPHHFGLEGIDSGPSLCNQTMGSKSAPMPLLATNAKVLKDNGQTEGLYKHGPE